MEYGKIISDSWDLLWKNKILWLLGFLAAIGGGGSSGQYSSPNFQFPAGNSGQNPVTPEAAQRFEELAESIRMGDFTAVTNGIAALIGISAALLFGLIIVAIIFGIALWFVSLMARVGLVEAVIANQQGESIIWGRLLASSTRHLWQIVGLKLLLYGIPLLLFFSIFAATFGSVFLAFVNAPDNFSPPPIFAAFPALICGLICIGIPAMIAIQLTDGYAFRSIVIDRTGVVDGLKHGWRIGLDNFGSTVILGLLFLAIGIVGLIIIAVVVLAPMGILTALTVDSGTPFFAMLGIFFLVSMLISAIVNSFFIALQSIAFSKAYFEFTGRPIRQVPAQEALL